MRKSNITIYDLQMRKVAMLENAVTIGYETPMNALWTASFELPLDDPKNEYCHPFYYVELYDLDGRMDLYRILPNTASRNESDRKVSYSCEHVLATLIDDILFQYHTVGNLGVYTADSIQYILDHQSTKHWQLGNIEFTRQFEYNWENTNLFNALFSIPRPFTEAYMWTWDTTSYPWTLNLVKPSENVQAIIRYGHNMAGIERNVNPTGLVNRIYALGYGEGINQLNFAEINGGLPYIENPASIAKYGVKQDVWVDRRFTSAETLLARAQAILDESSEPRIAYTVDASELYALTGDPIDKFKTGAVVRIQDPDFGEHDIRVVNVKKGNVWGERGKVQLEIANKTQTIATAMADVQNRLRIEEVYAQGATNVNVYNLAENCDPTHPAILRFWVPDEAVRINKVLLTYESEPFRGYNTGAAAGGATSVTSASGGSSSPTSGPSSSQTTAGGGGKTLWFGDAGGINFGDLLLTDKSFIQSDGIHNHSGEVPVDGQHFHRIYNFRLTMPDHTHGMEHTHVVFIGPHTHEVTIGPHIHELIYGIFEGPTPTSVKVEIDNNEISGLGISESNIDITPYLSLDDGGKIKRGQFHDIKITPNNLGRISATVVVQFFVQSRGGGNY